MEAHFHEEANLWSFIVLFQKQIKNATRENKERNLTWRSSRGQKLLDTFRVLSGVHSMHTICSFKAQEVRSPTLQMVHKSELKLRSYVHWKTTAPSCEKTACENFTATKPPASTRVPLRKLKFHFCSCETSCEITSKLQNQPFLAKWTTQLAKSTCVISDICNWLS